MVPYVYMYHFVLVKIVYKYICKYTLSTYICMYVCKCRYYRMCSNKILQICTKIICWLFFFFFFHYFYVIFFPFIIVIIIISFTLYRRKIKKSIKTHILNAYETNFVTNICCLFVSVGVVVVVVVIYYRYIHKLKRFLIFSYIDGFRDPCICPFVI